MNIQYKVITVLLVLSAGLTAQDSREELDQRLSELAPFVGKTWKGVFSGSAAEQPVVDISRWERALNGKAIRILHSLNNGQYGGETIIMWDREKEQLVYFYFTTAGFYTEGTMQLEDSTFTSHEYVTGNKDGITEVKAVGEIKPDGSLYTRSSYLKEGNWTEGHEATYTEAPDAKVVFK